MTNQKERPDNAPSEPKGFVIQPRQDYWGTDEDVGLHIVLYQPEIPGNTGNIGRLCAGANIWLHLVEPLGFALTNKFLKRAGLDYWPHVRLCVHSSFDEIEEIFPRERLFFFSKTAARAYTDVEMAPGTVLVFGRETTGLGPELMARFEDRALRIPTTGKVRSLNLSNACAIVTYEALRQLDWKPLQG